MRPKEPKHRRRDLTVGMRHKDVGLQVNARSEIRSARCRDRKDRQTGAYLFETKTG